MATHDRSPQPLKPKQARSRQRLAAILDAAEAAILRDGMPRLTMSAVAKEAAIPIGSLYQYTPNMQVLLQALAERFLDRWRVELDAALAFARTPQDLSDMIAGMVRSIYAELRDHPERREIWANLNADPALAALDLADSRVNAGRIGDEMAHFGGMAYEASDLLMVTQLTAPATMMASAMEPEEGGRVIESYLRMILHHIGLPAARDSTRA